MVVFVEIFVSVFSVHPCVGISVGTLGIVYIPSMDPVEESVFNDVEYKEL